MYPFTGRKNVDPHNPPNSKGTTEDLIRQAQSARGAMSIQATDMMGTGQGTISSQSGMGQAHTRPLGHVVGDIDRSLPMEVRRVMDVLVGGVPELVEEAVIALANSVNTHARRFAVLHKDLPHSKIYMMQDDKSDIVLEAVKMRMRILEGARESNNT